jgi:hypothetical protein
MQSEFFDEGKILRKYAVQYFCCTACSFVQTETPYWLEEAYSSAIGRQDTGILARNLMNRRLTAAVLNLLLPEARRSVDYGAGPGIFVRLMRDSGFEFFWHDLYATNVCAAGFEYAEGETYDFLTAFEVLEHLVDPIAGLSAMMSLSRNVFVSTALLPHPTPRISDWWYFVPTGGQHISFYTLDALHVLARRFGRNLLSHGPFHLFTTAPKNKFLFRLATSQRASQIVNGMRRHPSLTDSDFRMMSK